MRITNNSGISLPLAVWLLHDTYDYIRGVENYISVTTLMKPLRQIIIPQRIPPEQVQSDVEDYIARTLGHAIHDSMEQAWIHGYERSMRLMGYPDEVIARIAINPTDEERRASNEMIPVYLEQREFRQVTVNGVTYTIGGKYDMVADGIVNDTKSTSVWGWVKGTKDDDHTLQMSFYRWLDAGRPEQGGLRRITEDFGQINYVFTDWSKAQSKSTPNYPPSRVQTKDLALHPLTDMDRWVHNKLSLIQQYADTPEAELPECTDEELWRSAPVHKYYSDPTKATTPGARATKNFDDLGEARRFMAEKGGKGTIITQPGEVKACGYCPAFDGCTQKDRYL